MKNFKLLLATTAILSTASVCNAAYNRESEAVDVKVEVIQARVLDNTVPLDFGRIVTDGSLDGIIVIMDSSGVSTIEGAGYILTQGTKGVVTGANCSQLSYPSVDTSIYLTPPVENDGSYFVKIAGCIDDSAGNATFYGGLSLSSDEDPSGAIISPVPAGVYTGSFTVTAIYPVAAPATPTEP